MAGEVTGIRQPTTVVLFNEHVVKPPFKYVFYTHILVLLSNLVIEDSFAVSSNQYRIITGQSAKNQ